MGPRPYLDCGIADDLRDSRAVGVAEASAENERQRAKGEAAGRALTYDDGYKGGYDAAYADGKQRGYDDPVNGYPAAYAAAYASGQQRGSADTASCANGSDDGAAGGDSAGVGTGEADGFDAGYSDGYEAGNERGIYGTTARRSRSRSRAGSTRQRRLAAWRCVSAPRATRRS